MKFGAYARNYLVSQGRYTPDKTETEDITSVEIQTHYDTIHVAVQACPGHCSAERCVNSYCAAHPNFKR